MKERERGQGKKEKGRLPTRERCEWWLVMTPTKCQPVSLGSEGETNGGYERKKKAKRIILENH